VCPCQAAHQGRAAALTDAVARSVQALYVNTMRPVFASLLTQAAVHATTANADALLDALAGGPLPPLVRRVQPVALMSILLISMLWCG
jgi:hypothetical protein